MVGCSASGCSNRSEKKMEGVTFHRFPKKAERRKAWTDAVQRKGWEPSPTSVLCSEHFLGQDLDRSSVCCVRLRETAIPSVFPLRLRKKNIIPASVSYEDLTMIQDPVPDYCFQEGLPPAPMSFVNVTMKQEPTPTEEKGFKEDPRLTLTSYVDLNVKQELTPTEEEEEGKGFQEPTMVKHEVTIKDQDIDHFEEKNHLEREHTYSICKKSFCQGNQLKGHLLTHTGDKANLRKRGLTVHSKEREMIRHIINCCDEEAVQRFVSIPVMKASERAAKYCRVSIKTIKRIRKESKNNPHCELSTPGRERKRPDFRNAVVDDLDRRIIRNVIEDFYLRQNVVPTCNKLLPVLKERMSFKWKATTLRRILKEMGFRWKSYGSNRKILVEKQDIINLRCMYLQKVRQFREDGMPIYYLDEIWVDTNLTFRKCWQSKDVSGMMEVMNTSNKLIIAHIGSSNGFLEGSELMYNAGVTVGDFHGPMNAELFEKWVCERVIPNLPGASVIVMDNASYHVKQSDKPPSKYAIKIEMIEYLQRHGVSCDQSMRKFTLYSLIETIKPKEKVFRIDEIFATHGHKIIRLPPYVCDLNPIELAWVKIMSHVRANNAIREITFNNLEVLLQEGIKEVTPADWAGYCHQIAQLENEYWEKDSAMEDVVDSLRTNLNSDESSDEDSSTEYSSDNEV